MEEKKIIPIRIDAGNSPLIKAVNTKFLPKSLLARYMELPTDANDPRVRWHCDVCGWIEPSGMSINEEIRYSKRKCPCQIEEEEARERQKQQQAWLANQSHYIYNWLGERWSTSGLKDKTFENFQVTEDWQRYALQMARAFARQLSGTLVLYGDYGTGKSHLLAALCNEILAKMHITSVFSTSPILFRAIQAQIQANQDYHHFIERAIKAKLFVLDDVDKAKYSEFREEIYFEIIDERVKAGLPTAISTNKLDELSNYVGGAVCSRLKIGQIDVPMFGADYREEL